jgi:hypothetical protein
MRPRVIPIPSGAARCCGSRLLRLGPEVLGGEGFIATLARRLARFDWSTVEHVVLNVLYESVISTSTRKALGEYYTPDWLANAMHGRVTNRQRVFGA